MVGWLRAQGGRASLRRTTHASQKIVDRQLSGKEQHSHSPARQRLRRAGALVTASASAPVGTPVTL